MTSPALAAFVRQDSFPDRLVEGGAVLSCLFSISAERYLQPAAKSLNPVTPDASCTIRAVLIDTQSTRYLARVYGQSLCKLRIEIIHPPRDFVQRDATIKTGFDFDEVIKRHLNAIIAPHDIYWGCGSVTIRQQYHGKTRLKGHWVHEENIGTDIVSIVSDFSHHRLIQLGQNPEVEFIQDPRAGKH